ncbi:TetR/AcrR family transcriptional regulator [Halieaceae bacterium IMCC8485]|jgi:AcrR family transcriptional regulator|uniref:TetR/AcrR family transcriptional regulator n=2 Tax=Candidatus Seongchinamella marina TaxID=2518990 RepID=A0ABT3SVG1_9GAMM|nr:TetR/AcrR family transcriptional regulator [Candidatus Seongchinamella marina]
MYFKMQQHYGFFMDTIEAPLGRREKRKQEIRQRIEDAAYQLFQQQGIEDTSIEEICVEADVARRTFYGHFTNKHALLGGLGITRLYSRSEPMLSELMANHTSTRARLQAMIDYIESSFAGMNDIDRQLVLVGPTAFAEDQERQREIGNSSMASFTQLINAGIELGDVKTEFTPLMLATTVVGTLNMLTISWCLDSSYPVFAKLEEARKLFDQLICKDNP